jgi:carbon storage regulator
LRQPSGFRIVWLRSEMKTRGVSPGISPKAHLAKETSMLVLTRKVGERIHIGNSIVVTVVRVQNDKVRIGIEAPPEVGVHREEVYRRVVAEPESYHAALSRDSRESTS